MNSVPVGGVEVRRARTEGRRDFVSWAVCANRMLRFAAGRGGGEQVGRLARRDGKRWVLGVLEVRALEGSWG